MCEVDKEQRTRAKELVARLGLKPLKRRHWAEFERLLESKTDIGYADTWTYLTQAANGYALDLHATGYFASCKEARCVIGIFKRPFKSDLAVHLINPLGERRLELVVALCEQMATDKQTVIYVKKADPELHEKLKAMDGFGWSDNFAWHAMAPQEDDTYPELLLDIARSLELFEPGRLNQARDKFARFSKRTRHCEVAWIPLGSGRYQDARQVIQRFFYHKKQDQIDISEASDYENMLVAPSPTSRPNGLVREICYVNGDPCALLVMECIGTSNAVGLYCNLALYKEEEYRYASEFVIHRALTVSSENGFRYMNLGGSESEGLHRFKKKFAPVDRMKRDWIAFSAAQSVKKRIEVAVQRDG